MKMDWGICTLTMVAVREKPSHKSQMINQLLFGEMINILDHYDSWLLVESKDDHYQGWVDNNQITAVSSSFYEDIDHEEPVFLNNQTALVSNGKENIILSAGSRLPLFSGENFQIETKRWKLTSPFSVTSGIKTQKELIETALLYLGSSYLWGGRSIFGLDCSGFTQIVFKICGYSIPRDSAEQAMQGELINFIHEALPGDLIFFENEDHQIIHVGIMMDAQHIIHASGWVRIDPIDHEGIFRTEKGNYSHKLRIIKRIFPVNQ